MSPNIDQLLKSLETTKKKNLEFFKQYFPNIYEQFAHRGLKNARLNIDPESGGIELIENEKAIYDGKGRVYCKNEAQSFSDAFKPGSFNMPLRHSYAGEFHSGRFSHASLENFLKKAGATPGSAAPYTFDHSLPQVVFLGCGMGYHIQNLLEIRDIRHVVVIEHNPNRFIASLCVTDWAAMIQPYLDDKTLSFSLSVGDTSHLDQDQRIQIGYASAWNSICLNVPFMPIQTVFYNHQADPVFKEIANRLNQEIEPSINVWGFYDDEINQLNHVIHNLKKKIPVLSKQDLSSIDNPIIICGNGPSLDDLIPLLKEHEDKVIIVSAGSTTYTLLKYGLKPDLVITLESDLITHKAFELLPKEKAKELTIIGAAQIHPHTFDLFGQSLLYIKQETAYSFTFGNEKERISNGTPSATNAALAVIMELGLKNVFLSGMDFGFKSPEQSHSEGSFYDDDATKSNFDDAIKSDFEDFKQNLSRDSYYLEDNINGKIYTIPFYNTSRTHAQRKLLESNRSDVINLSKGATIRGAKFGSIDALETTLQSITSTKPDIAMKLVRDSRVVTKEEIEQGINVIHNYLALKTSNIKKMIENLEPDIVSIEKVIFSINQEVINKNQNSEYGSLNMMIRGIIWFWLFNLYALAKKVNPDRNMETLVNDWKLDFSKFLGNLPNHMQKYILDSGKGDPRLSLTISEPEPNIEKWL